MHRAEVCGRLLRRTMFIKEETDGAEQEKNQYARRSDAVQPGDTVCAALFIFCAGAGAWRTEAPYPGKRHIISSREIKKQAVRKTD